jgi:hypothetical protein
MYNFGRIQTGLCNFPRILDPEIIKQFVRILEIINFGRMIINFSRMTVMKR